ncbi:MAG: NAD(P)/FAD-dependent oxidoreductase [Pelosinus sp.]|nr:NAD(P)/FAD-dependent oxidoreductase [Pelosinus sp.]
MANEVFDIAVVGGGPAGLSAALTGKIRNKSVVLFEHGQHSEKLQKAHVVDNYLGIPEVTGRGLMQQFTAHAVAHQVEIIKEKVVNIYPGEDTFTLLTSGNKYEARSCILATGVVATALFSGERDFLGRGVSYCATCDGMFYKEKDVAVISYTQEGEQEADYLEEICRKVYYLPQYKDAPGKMRSGITVLKAVPQGIKGDTQVEKLSTDKEELAVHGVFILRQSDPVENILSGLELEGEVIKVKRDMSTNLPGVFAAGDSTGKPFQIAKAVGEGLVAVLSAISYLDTKRK